MWVTCVGQEVQLRLGELRGADDRSCPSILLIVITLRHYLSFELMVSQLLSSGSQETSKLFRRVCKRHIFDSVLLFRRHFAILVFVDHVDVLLVLFFDGYEQS
jgi:hypothetical protein